MVASSAFDAGVAPARVLIVDDMMSNRFVLKQVLARMQATTSEASNGLEALQSIAESPPDLVLLDIEMPEMDGHQVLARLREDGLLQDLPVLIISAVDSVSNVAACLQAGAADYITKPFDATILTARVNACLERKRLRDREVRILAELVEARERSEELLLNVLPSAIAERLKGGEKTIADSIAEASVLHVELTDVTQLSTQRSPTEIVKFLNQLYSCFDTLAEQHGVDKMKTNGDTYVGAAGVLSPLANHAAAVADLALDIQREGTRLSAQAGAAIGMKIGIGSGAVVAGVVGKTKFTYDVFGDAVKAAAFLAHYGLPGSINVSQATGQYLAADYILQDRGLYYVDGFGELATLLLIGRS